MAPPSGIESLLQLQREAGNRAVVELLNGGGPIPLQRAISPQELAEEEDYEPKEARLTAVRQGWTPASQLQRGSRGDDVADLQDKLNLAGSADPPLVLDGIFGPKTQAAVWNFQNARRDELQSSGVVDASTWQALYAEGRGGTGYVASREPPSSQRRKRSGQAGKHARAHPPKDFEMAANAIQLVPDILDLRKDMVPDYWKPQIPQGMPAEYANMLWDFWKATTGYTFVDGERLQLDGQSRLAWMDRAMAELRDLVAGYKLGFPPAKRREIDGFVSSEVMPAVAEIRAASQSQIARTKTEKALKGEEAFGPELDAEREQLGAGIKETIDTLTEITEAFNRLNEHELTHAADKLIKDRDLPIPAGLVGKARILALKSLLENVAILLTLSDSKRRRELYEELSGEKGGLAQAASITEIIGWCVKVTHGSVLTATAFAGVIAKHYGQAALARRCFVEVAGGIGTRVNQVLSVVALAHGTMVACDPHRSPKERLEGLAEAGSGGVGVAQMFGWISADAAFAWTFAIAITWLQTDWILEKVGTMVESMYESDLRGAYDVIRRDGTDIAQTMLELKTLLELARQAKDKKAFYGFEREILKDVEGLRKELRGTGEHFGSSDNSTMPGYYRALRGRYATVASEVTGVLDERSTPPEAFVASARLLEMMKEAFKDYPAVKDDAMKEHAEKAT